MAKILSIKSFICTTNTLGWNRSFVNRMTMVDFICCGEASEYYKKGIFAYSGLGIEFYLFVSHEGMKRQRFHV